MSYNTFIEWIQSWSVFSVSNYSTLISSLIFCALEDINSLVGNNLPFEIPQALVKAVTHALAILHGLALIFAGASFLTGLVPLCGSCFRSLSSGFAAFITAGAFAVDLILFFGAKARISEVGSAQIGISIILTFVALVLLAVSSFFSICCL